MSIKHTFFSVFLMSFLLINGIALLCLTDQTQAVGREIYVDDSFSAIRDGSAEHPYQTITQAMNLADDGDTIYVFSGLYNETLIINKRISLIGGIDDGQTIIARRDEHKYLIDITADFVTLENFVIQDPLGFITSQSGALIRVTSDNVVLQKNNISQCSYWGVYLDSSDDNTISGNIINDTKGIYGLSSNNNVFSNNNISNSSDAGVNLRSSRKNILYDNYFTLNNYGVYAKDSSNMNMTQNTFIKNIFHGIYITGDTNDRIQGNLFTNNSVTGVTLDSYDCIISDNIFNYGQVGLSVQKTGSEIRSNTFENHTSIALSTIQGSSNNIIYLNHFKNNKVNAREKGSNLWDHDTTGNYWEDYHYVDRDLDGIGDAPYTITTGGKDHYPLGMFLKPPEKPSDPSPADDQENVGLKVTLSVKIFDMDSSVISLVSFYNAVNDEKIGYVRNVVNGSNATCSFTLPFDTTYAWYVIANDSLQQNQSDIWFFTTKQRPPENQKPVANPGGPYLVKLNQSVTFDGSQSIDPDGTIIFYRWNFGDGSSQILDMTPKHTYTDPGVYMVTLTVVDDDGRSSMANTTATIQSEIFINTPPNAMFTVPLTVPVNQGILFDATGSNDTDGFIAEYRWDFDSDGTFDTNWSTEAFITNSFLSTGPFVVTLEVKDDLGSVNSYSATVSVQKSSENTPGFDMILVLFCIGLCLLLFLKRRNTNH